jgi:hypothetical protein
MSQVGFFLFVEGKFVWRGLGAMYLCIIGPASQAGCPAAVDTVPVKVGRQVPR